jgi:hypothetical protein
MNDRHRQIIKTHCKYNKIPYEKSELMKMLKDNLKYLKKCNIKYSLHYIIKKDGDKNV